ncbi:MAG TPA: hypothetical protein VGU64_12095 [Terriglobales bacterium]|nr:hypothetical protein [Terriglobales bacterium]
MPVPVREAEYRESEAAIPHWRSRMGGKSAYYYPWRLAKAQSFLAKTKALLHTPGGLGG